MAVWVCLLLVPMIILLAISLQMGLIMDTRTELQLASDSAALAAARSLDGEATGLAAARAAAASYSQAHTAAGASITIASDGADLEFGRWHFDPAECVFGTGSDCFEPIATSEPRSITSVRIRNGRDGQGAHAAALSLPFGAFTGHETTNVTSSAVAVGGGARSACALPFGVAECKMVDDSNELRCNQGYQRFRFSNATNDGIGFVSFDGSTPNPPYVADVIRNGCDDSELGEHRFQNGNDLNNQIIQALQGRPQGQSGGTCLIGADKVHVLPVLDADCPGGNPQFTGAVEAVGYIQVRIIEVTNNQGEPQPCWGEATPAPIDPNNRQRSLLLDIMCEAPATTGEGGGGGRYYNSSGVKLRLVK